MGWKIKIIACIIGLIYLFLVFRNIKKNGLRPSYSFLWFTISVFLISIPVIEPFYQWLSHRIIGINDARHIIYIPLIGFLLVYSFFLTVKISLLSDRVQELISSLAIQDNELQKLKSKEKTKTVE